MLRYGLNRDTLQRLSLPSTEADLDAFAAWEEQLRLRPDDSVLRAVYHDWLEEHGLDAHGKRVDPPYAERTP